MPASVHERAIPASGERIPAVGMGTWLTFDVAPGAGRDARVAVLREFFAGGGALLDSSPMYGYAEAALGELVPKAGPSRVFNATKVWTPTRFRGSGVTSINTPTENSPSSLIHFGIQGHEWISEPVDADVTISGSITWNLRAEESNMGANAAINAAIYRMKATDLSLKLIDLTARTTELGTSEAAETSQKLLVPV